MEGKRDEEGERRGGKEKKSEDASLVCLPNLFYLVRSPQKENRMNQNSQRLLIPNGIVTFIPNFIFFCSNICFHFISIHKIDASSHEAARRIICCCCGKKDLSCCSVKMQTNSV